MEHTLFGYVVVFAFVIILLVSFVARIKIDYVCCVAINGFFSVDGFFIGKTGSIFIIIKGFRVNSRKLFFIVRFAEFLFEIIVDAFFYRFDFIKNVVGRFGVKLFNKVNIVFDNFITFG